MGLAWCEPPSRVPEPCPGRRPGTRSLRNWGLRGAALREAAWPVLEGRYCDADEPAPEGCRTRRRGAAHRRRGVRPRWARGPVPSWREGRVANLYSR